MIRWCWVCRCLVIAYIWINLALPCKASTGYSGNDVIYVKKRSDHTLLCETVVELVGGTVTWYKDDVTLQPEDSKYTFEDKYLTIHEFNVKDEGDYFCLSTSIDSYGLLGSLSRLRLPVRSPPVFDQSVYTINTGHSVRFVCPFQSWIPRPKIQWLINSQPACSLDRRYDCLPNGVIHITNAYLNDTGVWSCAIVSSLSGRAHHKPSQNNVTLTVITSNSTLPHDDDLNTAAVYTVLAKPEPLYQLISGDELLLECLLVKNPGVTTVWQRLVDEKWVEVISIRNTTVVNNRYIYWPSVRRRDQGEYRCAVKSFDGNVVETFRTYVSITEAPALSGHLVTNPYQNVSVDLSRNVKLVCPISGYPNPHITWYKDGKIVKICHNRQMSVKGALEVEETSLMDTGYYQCVGSNQYGVSMYTYRVDVLQSENAPYKPVMTTAKITDNSYLHVKWNHCNKPQFPTIAFTFVYSRDICTPDELSLTKVVGSSNADCKPCATDTQCAEKDCDRNVQCFCCEYQLELLDKGESNYTITLIAYSSSGGVVSDPTTAVASLPQPSPNSMQDDLGLLTYDFGSVLMFLWQPVADASSYSVNIQQQPTQGDHLIESKQLERAANQTFAVVKGYDGNTTLSVEIEAIATSTTHRQRKQIVRMSNKDSIERPNVEIAPLPDSLDLIVIWSLPKGAQKLFIWYKCDNAEKLSFINATSNTLQIPHVESRCDVVVAPMKDNSTMPAGIARYDRWCKEIASPFNVTVAASVGDDSSVPYVVTVGWQSHAVTSSCEINYLVQWKPSSATSFSYQNSKIIQSVLSTSVQGLLADKMYDFKVSAFTNSSHEIVSSGVVSYAVGPPPKVQQIKVDLSNYPKKASIIWSPPEGNHRVTVYIIFISKKVSLGWSEPRTEVVEGGSTFHFDVANLHASSLYNVTVTALNNHGAGPSFHHMFWTPDDVETPPHNTGQNAPSSNILTRSHLALIIGFSLAVLIIFIASVVCILITRRYKSYKFNRHGSHRAMSNQASSDSPYRETVIPLSEVVTEATPLQVDVTCPASPLRVLGSPQQLSHKTTSAQDSGIADDHRSSQDLEEYDTEPCLTISCLSLDDNLSHGSPARWSCDPSISIGSIDAALSKNTHKDAELDSLMANQSDSNIDSQSSTCVSTTADTISPVTPQAIDNWAAPNLPTMVV